MKKANVMVIVDDRSYEVPAAVSKELERLREVERGVKLEAAAARGAARPVTQFVPWSAEEEQRLAAGFDSGLTCGELAKAHKRSTAAIEARLLKIGKIDVSTLARRLA